MPLYEYQCCECQGISEHLQKFSDPPIKKCPHCGGKVSKIMSMNAFHLKGQGWYVTDYKGKNSSNSPEDKNSGAKSEKSEKKDKKTDTKKKDKKAEKSS